MRGIILAVILIVFSALGAPAWAAERITVFAAASMKDAMDRAAAAFEVKTGTEVVVSFAASSVLARQIEAGAPADVFVSANLDWMAWLEERGLIRADDTRLVAGNDLVVVAADGAAAVSEPASLLSAGRFAMGDPGHVPAGEYAKSALESLGLWETVKANAVFGENARVALERAARGEVEAAIVYGSDQQAAGGLSRVYTFPAGSHAPIVYPAAMTANGGAQAGAFLAFLAGEEGREIFAELGFSPVAE